MVNEKNKNVKSDLRVFGLNNQKDGDIPTSDEGYSLKQVFLTFLLWGKTRISVLEILIHLLEILVEINFERQL